MSLAATALIGIAILSLIVCIVEVIRQRRSLSRRERDDE